MHQSRRTPNPRALPNPVVELCAHLEERGIPSFSQGEGLLCDLHAEPTDRAPCRSLLCASTARTLLDALPSAVVSGEGSRRFTQATAEGPVDLVPCSEWDPEDVLTRFGRSDPPPAARRKSRRARAAAGSRPISSPSMASTRRRR